MKRLKKIDMHVHCIETRGIPKISGHFYPTVHELREIYDKIGVEKGVLLPPGTCPEYTTERLSPREAEHICREYNDTIGWWFCGIDPRYGNNNSDTNFSHYLNYYKSRGANSVFVWQYRCQHSTLKINSFVSLHCVCPLSFIIINLREIKVQRLIQL